MREVAPRLRKTCLLRSHMSPRESRERGTRSKVLLKERNDLIGRISAPLDERVRQRPRRSRHGLLRLDGDNGIDVDHCTAIACAASRAWWAFWAMRSKYGWTPWPSTVSETKGLR